MGAGGLTIPSPLTDAVACIGRERELTQVWEHLGAALRERARVVVVTGEPGIGKTRLLTEVATRATRAGLTVLRGGASEASGMPPYLPFLEALGPYIRATPLEALRQQVGAGVASLVSLFPELGGRLGDSPPAYPLPVEQARLRLYQAIGAFLAAIAATPPAAGLVLICDDLQWVDSSSLDLIVHVIQHWPTARLLFLAACRAGDIVLNPMLERALAELNRWRGLTTLALPPLTEEALAALATEHLHGPVEPAVSQLLRAHSEGNPFFAEELLRAWWESGALAHPADAHAGWTLTLPLGETLPASIASAIRLRLIRLPPEVVDQLRMAAVIGRTFELDLLAQIQAGDAARIADQLQMAEYAGLIHAERSGQCTFNHDKTRECLYGEVSSVRRQFLHGQIGLALEVRYAAHLEPHWDDLAFHFARSSDRTRAVHYAHCAAAQAMRAYAPRQAIAHLQTALDLAAVADPRRGDLWQTLGEAALLAAEDTLAQAAFAAAQTWFAAQGNPLATARAARGRGIALWRLDAAPAAHQTLAAALTLLDAQAQPGAEVVRTLTDLSNLLGVVLGQQGAALPHGQRALMVARQLGDVALEAAASRTVGFLLVLDNDLAAGIPLLEQALTLAQAHHDPVEAAACCACLAQAYCWAVEIARSYQVSLLRETLADIGPQPHQQGYVYTWLAFLHTLQGDWEAAEHYLALARPAVAGIASAEPAAFWHQVQGFLAFQQGHYRLAESALRTALDIFRAWHPGELLLCLGLFCLTLHAAGKRQETLTSQAEQEALLATLPAGSLPIRSARGCLALLAVQMGHTERAISYFADLQAGQGQHHWFLVDRILGEIALLVHDWPTARGYLAQALASAVREGLRPEQGRILLAQADLELAQGGPAAVAQARAQLTQGLALFRSLGMKPQTRAVRQKLRALPGPAATSHPAPLPAGLSPREAQVLQLVAAGQSNAEIAQTLHISASTVAKHLTAIFTKTGCANRAAATAFALRHGLA